MHTWDVRAIIGLTRAKTEREGMDMKTGYRIKERREALTMSAEKLAEKVGVVKTTIYRYEKGSIDKISAETIEAIAYVLQTTPDYLLGKTDDPSIDPSVLMQGSGKTHYIDLLYGPGAYSKMLEHTTGFLRELQANPKIAMLFDRTKRLTPRQLDTVLKVVDEIIGERDDA